MGEAPKNDTGWSADGRPGLLNILAASVQGVFDIHTLPIPTSQQILLPYRGALAFLSDPKGTLLSVQDGALTAARHWTDALLVRGAELRIPGASGLRVGEAINLSFVNHVWPGRASRLYLVDATSRDNPPDRRFQRELLITRELVESDDRPVALILHGFGSSTTGRHFEPLKLWLTDPAVGRYGLVLGFECDTTQGRLPDLAADLRDHLDRVGLLKARRRLDIYAHSMGGILARWLIENPEDADSPAQSTVRQSVRRLVMAGPPNLGARMAELGDELIRLLQRQKRFSEADMAAASEDLRFPLISALARRISLASPAARPLVQSVNDLTPGSDVLTALQTNPRHRPDAPTYYLIQGIYNPIPAVETRAVRLLRTAVALLGDIDPRQSDLIVDARSQAGCAPLLTGVPEAARPPQHVVLPQTWHHQYWHEPGTFETIRLNLLDLLPH